MLGETAYDDGTSHHHGAHFEGVVVDGQNWVEFWCGVDSRRDGEGGGAGAGEGVHGGVLEVVVIVIEGKGR